MTLGLVLTGGGARGAYQAGVLRAVAEIVGPGPTPFRVIAGTSAGGINAAVLASSPGDFQATTAAMWAAWEGIRPSDVFRTDALTIARTGLQWVADLGLGGLGGGRGRALLDTSPLARTVSRIVNLKGLPGHLDAGTLHGVALTATRYDTGMGVSFFAAAPNLPAWERRTRLGLRTQLTEAHVLASSAIPVFFPAVEVDGAWYGDGCVRASTPLSPAIHLGADRILAIGVRAGGPRPAAPVDPEYPSKARIAGLLLDALFLDALDADLERVQRINRTLALIGPEARRSTPLRHVEVVAVQPAVDLGELGKEARASFPPMIRHMFAGLGATEQEGWELMSYLAFDGAYTRPVLEAGYRDGQAHRREIEALLG